MKQIFKILSKSWFAIIVIFVLLVVKANFDLSLPDYTSKVINVGISQNGIENTTFEVISESMMNKVLIFTDKDDEILENYELIKKNNKEYIKKYPLLKDENIYILKTDKNLDKLFETPLLMIYILTNENMNQEMMKNMKLPENTDIFQIFSMMEYKNIEKIIKEVKNKTSDLAGTLLEQATINIVKDEYVHIKLDLEKMQIDYIIRLGIQMIVLSLLIMLITIFTSYLSSVIGAKFSRDLRSKVVNKVMSYSNKEFESISTSSLITRATNDISQIQMLITMVLRIVLYAPIIGLGALGKVTGSPLEWIIGVAVITILLLIIILFSFAIPKFKKLQKLIDRINLVSREILTGIPVIRAFANEPYEEKKFDEANIDLTKTNLFISKVMNFMMPAMMLIMYGMEILIIWVGSTNVNDGLVQIGDIFAFISYSIQIIMSFLMISMVSIILPRAWVSVKRISEIFNKDTSIKDPTNPKKLKNGSITVEFKDVYFRYPDAVEDVIENISFKALPGTTTALIGSTGSGKSTLINLLPRFFDVTNGKILFNNINIKDLTLSDLRSNIGFVPQKGNLFSGTIEDNIMFGKKISKEKMKEISKIAAADEFIDKLDDKYKSAISQGGTNVSGGQKQRLAIARAIAVDPKIYVFDDSFSALDYKTDSRVRKALKKYTKDATIFIVAQRISTIMHADQIIVLDEGKIAGMGTHKELLNNCSVYQEIAYSQLSEEELK